MFRLFGKPFTAYSPDEAAGGGADAPVVDPQVPAPEGADTGGVDYKAELAKREKDVARLANTVKGLQEKVKSQGSQQQPKSDAPVDPSEHPLLKDLARDQYGDVELDGQALHPALALRILQQEQRLNDLLNAEQNRSTASERAVFEQTRDGAVEDFVGIVSELAKVALPGLEGDALKDTEDALQDSAIMAFSRLYQSEDGLTVEALQAAAQTIVERERRRVAAVISKQLSGNQQYASDYPFKPDGQPGHKVPTDERTMSRADRVKVQEERVRRAEAASQR